jgi:hypothetical protein
MKIREECTKVSDSTDRWDELLRTARQAVRSTDRARLTDTTWSRMIPIVVAACLVTVLPPDGSRMGSVAMSANALQEATP